MSKHHIKYPVAEHKQTEELFDISSVTDDVKKELACPECKEVFVAVLDHQTPHFKHKSNSKCKGNVESYIHLITKKIFKRIKKIELPEIFKDNLLQDQREKLDNKVDNLIERNVPENLQFKFRKDLKKSISKSGVFQIENVEIEKEYKTSLGNVRIDIVITINNQELFIEPFFTNQIDDFKKKKLILLNRPTLSIDLLAFIHKYNFNYSLEILENYLISKISKYWIFNRSNKIEEYNAEYLNYVLDEIKGQQNYFNINFLKLQKIVELENKVKQLEEKIRPTEYEICKARDEIIKIKDSIGVKGYRY